MIKRLSVAALLAALSTGAVAAPVLWIGDSDGTLGTVDVANGAVTVVGQMGDVMTDIAFDPSGNLWGISFGSLYKIDKNDGTTTFVGNTGQSLNSLVFDDVGTLYAANTLLFTLNTATGAATSVGGGGGYTSSGDLAFIGSDLYLSSTTPESDSLYLVDAFTGVGVNMGAIGFSAVYGMATDNNVDLYGLSGNNVIKIDTATGAGALVRTYVLGDDDALGIAWGTAFYTESGAPPVPLPAAAWLLVSGLAGLGVLGRRKAAA